jgi:enoyl-CoA hydratase/carnithine racemase
LAIELVKEGRLAIITINRPRVMNALDAESGRQLHQALDEFGSNPELWVGIVTGAGEKAFCTGADIRDLLPAIEEQALPASPVGGLVGWKPLIAAINGLALGGGLEVALACDIRIASETAQLGTPEVSLGLIPGWGGSQRLPRLIPGAKAAEMLLTGQPITAGEAYRIGLVNQVVAPRQLMPTARRWAEVILQKAPLAVGAAKEAMARGLNMSLDDGLELESRLVARLMATKDYTEGVTAFLEKRGANFNGK